MCCSGENNKKTSSRLVIAGVQRTDSGNYTCTTDTARPSVIVVYVSDGKYWILEKFVRGRGGSWKRVNN